MLKAAILTPQHKEPKPKNNSLSTIIFLQVPHHIEIHMKPIKLQAVTERKKLLGDFNAKKKHVCIHNSNYCHNFNTYQSLNFRKT